MCVTVGGCYIQWWYGVWCTYGVCSYICNHSTNTALVVLLGTPPHSMVIKCSAHATQRPLSLNPHLTPLQLCHPGRDLLEHWRMSPAAPRGAEGEEEEEDWSSCDGDEEGGTFYNDLISTICTSIVSYTYVHTAGII